MTIAFTPSQIENIAEQVRLRMRIEQIDAEIEALNEYILATEFSA